MGITRSSAHKRRLTGGKRKLIRKKRKFELGRPAANTKLGPKRVHTVRCMGGLIKKRALRLDSGNFSWGTEAIGRKVRILDVVYNASNNELVRTKTIVKNCIVLIDATPFKQYYEQHYGITLGKKRTSKTGTETAEKKLTKVQVSRQKKRFLDSALEEQFNAGRLLACISSPPGQTGRADGYLLEAKELEFYQRKLQKKGKNAKST
eukprot:TRINITY_DN57_c0_g1_i1.p1 TRINITY_DN57_c0_g1~~TRINITY_DN57_c0_g1_i1.p1  ORF type:complete len:206 (-),score=43.43 TRINITY_DN57_c0_g1_i1:39-656(-)